MNGGERQQTCGLVRRTAVRAARARDRCLSYAPVPHLRARHQTVRVKCSPVSRISTVFEALYCQLCTRRYWSLWRAFVTSVFTSSPTPTAAATSSSAPDTTAARGKSPANPIALEDELIASSVASVLFAALQKGSKSVHRTYKYVHTELRVCLLLAPKNKFKNKTWTFWVLSNTNKFIKWIQYKV